MLGVYPSALHVRWSLPDASATVGALAVDDEPTVFWDGADAAVRIDAWKREVGWTEDWGSVGAAGGNGSSGRLVVDHVLRPLGVSPSSVYFTDCLPTYFVKYGTGSQGARIQAIYQPFAGARGLPRADLPPRPPEPELIGRSVAEEGEVLLGQLVESRASRIVTLGQEAASVLAAITGADPIVLRSNAGYGRSRSVVIAGAHREWIPLTHPGNRTRNWVERHRAWMGPSADVG